MTSQTQQLLLARKNGSLNNVDKTITRRIQRKGSRRSNSSPNETDTERIINDYGNKQLRDSIINKKTAREFVDDLMSDKNLENYIRSAGKQNFVEYVFESYSDENISDLLTQEIQLKTKTIFGFKFSSKIYIRETKAGLRAFRFKDNRFAKMPKTLFKKSKKQQ